MQERIIGTEFIWMIVVCFRHRCCLQNRNICLQESYYSMILILLTGDIETCLGHLFTKGNFALVHQNECGLLSKRENLENLSQGKVRDC